MRDILFRGKRVDNALTTKKPDEYDLYYKDNLEVIGNIFDNGGEK